MPDVFVPRDTTGVTSYLMEVSNKGLLIQFSFQYTDRNRAKLDQFNDETELQKYLEKQNIVEQFVQFAAQKGVKRRNLLINKSRKLLERNLYGNIIYNIQGKEAYIRYINRDDATVLKALEILERGEAFPKAPTTIKEEKMIIGKKELRKYIAELKTLHTTSTTLLSDEILSRVEKHPVFQKAQTVLLYYSLPDEVHTHDFIQNGTIANEFCFQLS